ncbi:hypothetical protein CBL_20859 [Carabus blaptoides fortunei]
MGAPFIEIISDLISECSTEVMTPTGPTRPIQVQSGVKQGCALSGLLFNLAVNPLIELAHPPRILHDNINPNHEIHVLAYADDITLITDSAAAMRESPFPGNSDLKRICDTGLKIMKSKLAPWQRIDALKTFIYPSMHHHMRTGRFLKKDWNELDRIFRAEIKKTLNVPQEAANEYLYGPRSSGLCGIPVAATTSDQAIVDSAFKLLTSPDRNISTLALKSLDSMIEKRTKNISSDLLRARFLSGDSGEPFNNRSSTPSSLWSNVRKASTRLQYSWHFQEGSPSIIIGPTEISSIDRHNVLATARKATQQTQFNRLISLRSQGKSIECVSKDSVASHFLTDGSYTRFADWRFVHRDRLNLVPLNANNHTINPMDQRSGCRRCPYHRETLAHVLNHCMINSTAYQNRHDSILDRIETASRYKHHIICRNQQFGVPGLRPDLIIAKGNTAFIIDVTVAFENRIQAFQDARQAKINKYAPLAGHLATRYTNVSIEPIVVGSLGSWHTDNDKFLKKICTRSYSKLMKKLIVSDTIRWSRDIYVEHLSGIRQFQPGDRHPSARPAPPPASPVLQPQQRNPGRITPSPVSDSHPQLTQTNTTPSGEALLVCSPRIRTTATQG